MGEAAVWHLQVFGFWNQSSVCDLKFNITASVRNQNSTRQTNNQHKKSTLSVVSLNSHNLKEDSLAAGRRLGIVRPSTGSLWMKFWNGL